VNLGIALGQLISNSVIKGFGGRTDRWAYRGPFAIQLFFAAFLAVGLVFARKFCSCSSIRNGRIYANVWPAESPWWLVRQGRTEDAKKSLRKLYGSNVDLDTKIVAMQVTVDKETSEKKGTWLDCFRGTNLLRTGISCGVFACQHLVGIIFVLGYR
jgi:hypothetical protein